MEHTHEHEHEGHPEPRGAQDLAQRFGAREVLARVDQHDIRGGGVHERGRLGGDDPHPVAEQCQRRQGVRVGGRAQDQQLRHAGPFGAVGSRR